VLRLTADDSIATNHSDVTVIENLPPAVNAGTSILTNGLHAVLNGSVADDGLPGAFLSVQWSQSSEPGTINFQRRIGDKYNGHRQPIRHLCLTFDGRRWRGDQFE
jgi:hypothetical protein